MPDQGDVWVHNEGGPLWGSRISFSVWIFGFGFGWVWGSEVWVLVSVFGFGDSVACVGWSG